MYVYVSIFIFKCRHNSDLKQTSFCILVIYCIRKGRNREKEKEIESNKSDIMEN